jgi:hypothetical protein
MADEPMVTIELPLEAARLVHEAVLNDWDPGPQGGIHDGIADPGGVQALPIRSSRSDRRRH